MKILKIIISAIVFLIALASVQDAGIEGGSHLLSWFTSFLVFGFVLLGLTYLISKFRKNPASQFDLKGSLIELEPYLNNVFRIAVLMLLMLCIDKIDKFTWDIARNQLAEQIESNEKLTDIYDSSPQNQ